MTQSNVAVELQDPADKEQVSWGKSLPYLKIQPGQTKSRRAGTSISTETLLLARSLQLRVGERGVILFAETKAGPFVADLVQDMGKALVDLGAEDVLVLDLSNPEAKDQDKPQVLQRVLDGSVTLESALERRGGVSLLRPNTSFSERHGVAGEKARALFKELRARFRYVLVAAPSYDEDVEVRLLSTHADGIVLVLQSGQGHARLLEVQRQLKADHVTLFGTILASGPA